MLKRAAVLLAMGVSLCEPARPGTAPRSVASRRWAVVVGIDDYRYLPPLHFAVHDAAWLCCALVESCQFDSENVFPLTTEWRRAQSLPPSEGPLIGADFWEWFERQVQPASRENVLARLRWLREQVGPADLVLFHFSGHGALINEQGYLAMSEAEPTLVSSRLEQSDCIRLEEIVDELERLPVRAVVVFFDACRNDMTRSFTPDAAPLIPPTLPATFVRNISIQASGGTDRTNRADTSGPELSAGLFACREGEVSYDWQEKRHGFFTYFLATGLLGAARDEAGKVTLNSLEEYLAKNVAATVREVLGEAQQKPWMRREGSETGNLVLSWAGLVPPDPPSGLPSVGAKRVCVCDLKNLSGEARLDPLGWTLAFMQQRKAGPESPGWISRHPCLC